MGKFPGKPSKIVNRKRVKASKCSSSNENDSVKAAENIYFGLTVFNEAFGSEQVTSEFLGFSVQEAKSAVLYAKKQQREVISEYKGSGIHISLRENFERELSHLTFSSKHTRRNDSAKRTRKHRNYDTSGTNSKRDVSLPKKLTAKSPPGNSNNLKNKAARKLLQRAKKSSNFGSIVSTDQEKGNGAVRKFVLPSRSVHSSRVIKPNKRFIEAEEVFSSANRSPNTVELKKPRLLLNSVKEEKCDASVVLTCESDLKPSKKVEINRQKTEISGYNSSDGSNRSLSPHNSSQENSLIVEGKRRWKPSYKVQLRLREFNVFGSGTNRFSSKRTNASNSTSTRSIHSSSDKELCSASTDSNECGRLSSDCGKFGDKTTRGESASDSKSQWPGSKLNSGKVILRKARLKLNTHLSSGVEGPFSVNVPSGNPSFPRTVECGVCGAVRFYRFVKQARKFGIFSCESCRKFISKMMKRQACAKGGSLPILECQRGAGMCSVPPIVRSQQWKPGTQLRCSYKARCPACWLKKCLRSFKMPNALRDNMLLMLPPEMRQDKLPMNNLCMRFDNTSSSFMSSTSLEMEKLPCLPRMDSPSFKTNFCMNQDDDKKTSAFNVNTNLQNKLMTNSSKRLHKSDKQKEYDKGSPDKSKKGKHVHPKRLMKKSGKIPGKSKDNPDSSMERLRKKKNSGVKVRKKSQKSDGSSPNSDATRRQKLDLKGPRVKHVCRSASIVLGQPQATFPVDKKLEKVQVKPIQDTLKVVQPKSSCCVDCTGPSCSSVKIHNAERSSSCLSVVDSNKSAKLITHNSDAENIDTSESVKSSVSADTSSNHDEESSSVSTTYRRTTKSTFSSSITNSSVQTTVSMLPIPVTRTLPTFGKRAVPELQNPVSIDFWESYDPDEVCKTGFGIIGSEPFHVRAMCFLCGSAGHEKLIHCALCCEPYHKFCLEDGLRDTTFLSDGINGNCDEWRFNWVCQRCTVCHSCGRGLGQQLSCQRCHRTYHAECLGVDRLSNRLNSPDRPWVCSTCLRCKSCGTTDVTLFVGNLPLCKVCFKLRQKGNYCPLCQRCYEDDDFDTKMMECGQCKCWVHAKCEGLSDEKYQVLSYLPESVEFICRMCCVIPPAPWWLAVEEELRAGYLGVLKSLSKNRKACAMLKWSPKKQCLCRSTTVAKRLNFQEISDRDTETDEQSDSARGDTRVLIPKKEDIECSQDEITPTNAVFNSCGTTAIIDTSNHDVTENNLKCTSQTLLSATNTTINTLVPKIEHNINDGSSYISLCLKDSIMNELNSSNVPVAPLSIDSNTNSNSLKHLRVKYNIRECSVRMENCALKPGSKLPLTVKIEDNDTGFSPDSTFSEYSSKSPAKIQVASMATPASDSGIGSTDDELKPNYIEEEQEDTKFPELNSGSVFSTSSSQSSQLLELAFRNNRDVETFENVEKCTELICETPENIISDNTKECYCSDQHTLAKPSPTLFSIKKKVNTNEYSSLLQFHQEMEQLITRAQCIDLLDTYHHTLKEIFPWFDPKYARVSNNWKEGRPYHEESMHLLPVQVDHDHLVKGEQFHRSDITHTHLTNKRFFHRTPEDILGHDDDYYYSGFKVKDLRTCVLCKSVGDGLPVEEGRLLYCGQNEWVHANCALWSAEVFEEIDGSLQNVHSAVSRGRMIRCRVCGKKGASVGCCARNCAETFHFPCARRIGCAFMDDKTVFCSVHFVEAEGKPLHLDIEFDIRRPIYVELDRKKKKFAEPCQVKFMIGSLLVENLGEFVSASDHPDIIVPAEYHCTRLYWSSVEPWRIVQYYVKTIVQVAEPQLVIDMGKNLTVDHSQEQKLVKQKLEEVSQWHQQLVYSHQKISENKVNDHMENLKTERNNSSLETNSSITSLPQVLKKQCRKTTDEKVARQVLDHILDAVCNRDVDDNCLSDPQTTADLLPPELKDAIFEDLPHDLLDGISMQDIFPKLMSYEDNMVALDLKNDVSYGSDGHKEEKVDLCEDVIIESDVEQCEHLIKGKKQDQSDMGSHTDLWLQQYSDREFVEDIFQNICMKGAAQKSSTRELKRSKSEVIPQPVSKRVGNCGRSHQRSCSLTWSCKLDGSLTTSTKRRKGTRTMPRSAGEGASSLVMVVDSERAHMLQELRLPDGVLLALARSGTSGVTTSVAESVRELKYRLEEDSASNDVTGSINRRKSTHQEEEGKENKCLIWHGRTQSRILQLDGAADSCSSSGSEIGSPLRQVDDDYSFPPTVTNKNLLNSVSGKTMGEEEPVKCNRCHRTYRTRISFERHLPTCSSDFILSTSESDSENTRSSEEEGSKKQKFSVKQNSSTPIEVSIYSDDKPDDEDHIKNIKVKAQIESVSNISTQVLPKQTRPKTSTRVNAVNGRSRVRHAIRTYSNRSAFKKENNSQIMNITSHSQQSSHSLPCQTQTSTPTVIMQQVPSPNMVPAFVEAFQQQTGQSLQYIATIDAHSNGFNKTPYITTTANSLVPGTFQLQTSPESYVNIQNSGISVLPGVQLAASQPAVIGTLIHQTPPATIQCVAAEQVVLGSTPALEMYTDQSGGMFLTSQPMYYGLETIVSNTVMSSSQFVSAAVPGMMAASSSFSATTTQVFQASKLVEPLVDVPSSFVIMNPHGTQLSSESAMGRQEVISCTSSSLPMNLQSSVPQPSPSVIPQTQTPPVVNNTSWSYSEYNSETYLPPTNELDQLQTNSSQSIRTDISSANQTTSSLPPITLHQPTPPSISTSQVSLSSISPLPSTQLISPTPTNTPLPPPTPVQHVLQTQPIQRPQISPTPPVRQAPTLLSTSLPPTVSPKSTPQPTSSPSSNFTSVQLTHSHSMPTKELLDDERTEIVKINIPVSVTSNKILSNSISDSSSKMLKPNNNFEIPVHTINRVFPLKLNSIELPQALPKTKKDTMTENDSNNRLVRGSENTVTIIPLTQNKHGNNNNSNNKQSNSLKLVFQKQAQDGYYKISNQNNQPKLFDSKSNVLSNNQSVSVRTVKIKPRMVAVSDKQKTKQHSTLPVLQRDSKINTQNGSTNSHQNGKIPPFQEKNILGNTNSSPTITYEVHSQDGFSCTSSSITEVWQKVFEAVQEARELHKMARLPENPFGASSAGLQMLGLHHNAVRYLVEQLPGVGRCIKYKPRYHKLRPPGPEDDADALPRENPSGCIRCEPFKIRSEYDMFSWLASRHRRPPKFMVSSENESSVSNRRATSTNLPMAMRFRHLKETSKEAVGVYRSNIHGRGLFCLRDIEAGEMVIEYAGEVIRSLLTDKREKYYESKDIGCYMFRIDDQLVVDATMRGNAARFINHSCEPNCYSRVVDILGKKHILIFALRRIPQGEELTYDYKFPIEDVKIPCTCGSRKCRKYLN